MTADGAEWIWNLVVDYFPDSVQIIDWYDDCQRLALATAALFPDTPGQSTLWFQQHCQDLYRGEIHKNTLPLDHAGLSQQARYFHQHKRRMQDQSFFEDCYPIGSGPVESGIKQFKARLTGFRLAAGFALHF